MQMRMWLNAFFGFFSLGLNDAYLRLVISRRVEIVIIKNKRHTHTLTLTQENYVKTKCGS